MESIVVMDLQEQIKELRELVREYEELVQRLPHFGWWYSAGLDLKARAVDLGIINREKEQVS